MGKDEDNAESICDNSVCVVGPHDASLCTSTEARAIGGKPPRKLGALKTTSSTALWQVVVANLSPYLVTHRLVCELHFEANTKNCQLCHSFGLCLKIQRTNIFSDTW